MDGEAKGRDCAADPSPDNHGCRCSLAERPVFLTSYSLLCCKFRRLGIQITPKEKLNELCVESL